MKMNLLCIMLMFFSILGATIWSANTALKKQSEAMGMMAVMLVFLLTFLSLYTCREFFP